MGMGKVRGEYRKSAVRRAQIVDAAFVVFARSGFIGSSINEIAREVEMTPTGVMHHFRGKTELLSAVLQRRDAIATEILAERRGVDALRGLIEISRRQVTQRGIVQAYSILAAEATAPDHPAHDYFAQRIVRVTEFTIRAFREARDDGHTPDDLDVDYAGTSTLACVEGVEAMWLHGWDVDIVELPRRHIQAFLTVPL